MRVHHVNLQTLVGGGEVYTRHLTRALADCGAEVTLYVHPENRFWDSLPFAKKLVASPDDLPGVLPPGELVVQHTKIPEGVAAQIASTNTLVGFAHLPMFEREPEWLSRCALVVTVSKYCIDLLRRAGVERLHPEPLYGVADGARGDPAEPIAAGSPYLWDRRKFRDRVLGLFEPAFTATQPRHFFQKRPTGLTLGIVSLIMPIKQFPLLFRHIAKILARHEVNLEVFGAGGYAQVRDLKAALAPVRERTRFWGYHANVAAVYPQLDYLLTGLPEKEALGLNVLEAQICGTPVLAPRAPPFIETVLDGRSGYLYRDPRQDDGADFEKRIKMILEEKPRLDPRLASNHLAEFSYDALVERTRRLLASIQGSRTRQLA